MKRVQYSIDTRLSEIKSGLEGIVNIAVGSGVGAFLLSPAVVLTVDYWRRCFKGLLDVSYDKPKLVVIPFLAGVMMSAGTVWLSKLTGRFLYNGVRDLYQNLTLGYK